MPRLLLPNSIRVLASEAPPHTCLQAFQLGQRLRERYCNATGLPAVPQNATTVFSTDVDRTVDTAHALLLGLLMQDAAVDARPPEKCGCRPQHGARSSTECVAQCLQLPGTPPQLPAVQVCTLGHSRACLRVGIPGHVARWLSIWRSVNFGAIAQSFSSQFRSSISKQLHFATRCAPWGRVLCDPCACCSEPHHSSVVVRPWPSCR